MADIYLYLDVPVLKNKLDIKDEKTLDLIEAEQSRANMMLLYAKGLDEFSTNSLCAIHKYSYLRIFTNGLVSTDALILKSVKNCWQDAVCGKENFDFDLQSKSCPIGEGL